MHSFALEKDKRNNLRFTVSIEKKKNCKLFSVWYIFFLCSCILYRFLSLVITSFQRNMLLLLYSVNFRYFDVPLFSLTYSTKAKKEKQKADWIRAFIQNQQKNSYRQIYKLLVHKYIQRVAETMMMDLKYATPHIDFPFISSFRFFCLNGMVNICAHTFLIILWW